MSRPVKVIREAFFHGFQPLFTVAVFVAWWFLPGRENAPLELAIVVLLVANGIVYALEHLAPDRQDWRTSSPDRRIDALYVTLRVFVLGPLLQVTVLLGVERGVHALGLPTIWPTGLPVLARIILCLAIAECIAYALHVTMHRVPALWRFHAVHHVQTKMTSARWSTGHPVEFALLQLPLLGIFGVLGPETVDIAGAIIIGRTTAIIAHSNLRLGTKSIGWLLTTPGQHRRHHARGSHDPANYGDVFIVFDRILRSYRTETADVVGLGSGKELTFSQQMMLPLRMDLLSASPDQVIDIEHVIDLREPNGPAGEADEELQRA